MKTQELNYIKTTISWLLENGDFEDSETSYNTAMNSIDILEEAINYTRCCETFKEDRKEDVENSAYGNWFDHQRYS